MKQTTDSTRNTRASCLDSYKILTSRRSYDNCNKPTGDENSVFLRRAHSELYVVKIITGSNQMDVDPTDLSRWVPSLSE
jgi:hypothetical protein